jgi:hypothetical protein
MDLTSTIIVIVMGFVLSVLSIFLLILYFREDDEKYEDNLIINMLPQYTSPVRGHAIGLEVNTKVIDNKYLIEYQPRDVDSRLLKDKTKIDNVKVVVDKNKVITLPKGTLSAYRTLKILLPPNPEDFSSELKRTHFGQHLMKITEEINTSNVEAKIVREGSDRKTKLLTELGDGEISEQFLDRQNELQKELDRNASKPSTQSVPARSPFSPPSSI